MPETTPDPRPLTAETAPSSDTGTTWQRTTVANFLALDEPTIRLIDLKISLTRAIIRLRGEAKLTQADLAKRASVARPRIAEIEAFRPQTSFDTILPVYFAVGGTAAEFAAFVLATDQSISS